MNHTARHAIAGQKPELVHRVELMLHNPWEKHRHHVAPLSSLGIWVRTFLPTSENGVLAPPGPNSRSEGNKGSTLHLLVERSPKKSRSPNRYLKHWSMDEEHCRNFHGETIDFTGRCKPHRHSMHAQVHDNTDPSLQNAIH